MESGLEWIYNSDISVAFAIRHVFRIERVTPGPLRTGNYQFVKERRFHRRLTPCVGILSVERVAIDKRSLLRHQIVEHLMGSLLASILFSFRD